MTSRKDPGYYFAEPVDTDAVPDYLSVIAEPMDFGTIRTRVEQNAYRDAASFERDMRLVVDNAMLFNPPTTQYWQVAERISRWLPRAVERETELAITPAEEEALQEEERRKQEQIQRNLAMGLTADGKPRRGGRRKQTADIVPEGYVPAALRFGLPTDPAAGVGGGSATPGGDTPQDSGRGSLARDMSASRSVTPGTAARRRTSASPVKQDPDADENGDMGSPADGDVDPSASSASYRRRSMRGGPRASISAARAARQSLLGIGPRLTASNIHDAAEGITSLQLSYRPDGSIDPSDIEDPASTLLSSVYGDSERVLAPMLTAVVGVPRESEPQVKRRKNPVTGKEAVMLTEPGDVQETYSHELGALPPGMQQLPFSLPAHSAGPWKSPLQLDEFGLPLRWPVGVKLRTTPIVPAQAAAVQLANQNDWTYSHLRPTIKKLLSHTDVGPYANVVPARAVNPKGELSDFSYLHGETLRKALIDEQHSVPALALAIPDVPAIPTDLTHLIWTNMYRDYKPHLTEVVQQGIRGSTLLRNVVYGSAIGEAYTRSIAEFVGGAARGVVERYGPAEDEVEQAEPQEAVGKTAAELQTDALPPVKREREESPGLEPADKRVKLEQDDSALPEMHLVEEASPEPDLLDQPLVDWVRDKIVDPLTGGHLKLLIAVAEGFRRHPDETAGEGEKHTVGENADPALLASVEEVLRDVDAAAAAEAASDAAPLDPLLAESLGSITTDPSPRMRYNELKRLFESRIDLSEFVVPAPDLPEPGPTGSIADVASGTPLIRFAASGEDMTDERVEAALQQYAAVFADISKRGRELDRKSLLDNLRKGLLQIAVKRAPPAEMMQLPKHLVTYLRSLQAAATSPSA